MDRVGYKAPKPWSLKESETAESLESWWTNQVFNLSCFEQFAEFVADDYTWRVKGIANRGLADDPGRLLNPPTGRTAAQKVSSLNFMLEQLAVYIVPIISKREVVERSTSLKYIYDKLRSHYGIQPTGARFIDFYAIRLKPDERYETLYQRLLAFMDDNLLSVNGGITHHGVAIVADEAMSPTIENMIVLRWLELIHPGLPALVKQKYATNLRAVTLASIKAEVSLALPALLEEINNSEASAAAINRIGFASSKNVSSRGYSSSLSKDQNRGTKRSTPNCSLCQQAGRPAQGHFIQSCKYLPENDKRYFARARCVDVVDDLSDELQDHQLDTAHDQEVNSDEPPITRRVKVSESPVANFFYDSKPHLLMMDSGAMVNIARLSAVKGSGMHILPATQSAKNGDDVSHLDIIGEVDTIFHRGSLRLRFHALVATD